MVVAEDGSGAFTTIQEAVNEASKQPLPTTKFLIYVKAGVYAERVTIPASLPNITMYGDGMSKTVITGSRHYGDGTSNSLRDTATFLALGGGFIAQDMTFQNTAGPEAGQALSFLSSSDQSALYHCSFEGYQDTLYAISGRQFYKECQIFGTVDFIFGNANAVFQDCGIFFRKPKIGGGLVLTANGRSTAAEDSGFSLQGCYITAGDDLRPVLDQYNKAFLGRPWRPYARTIFMESYLDDVVDPQGWLDSWGFNETSFLGEYNNYGPGSSTVQRVKWPSFENITNRETAEPYTVAQLIDGNIWLPNTGVPCNPGFEKN